MGLMPLRAAKCQIDEFADGVERARPGRKTHPPADDGDSTVDALVAVVGLRRGSWRRFEMPASLLNEELDLPYLLLFEKLCFAVFDLVNILATLPLLVHRSPVVM